MDQRLFTYVFALAYPAVLGSFLFGLIANGGGLGPGQLIPALVMIVYFLIQFGEGVAAGKPEPATYRFGRWRFLQELLEMISLVWVFAALGLFEGANGSSRFAFLIGTQWWGMAVAFAIPPLFRAFRYFRGDALPENDRLTNRDRAEGPFLNCLSALAVAVCIAAAFAVPTFPAEAAVIAIVAIGAVGILIAVYFTSFIGRQS